MLIFDQLRKNDRQLQVLSICVLSGLGLLLLGLWYVQVLSAKRYKNSQISQSCWPKIVPATTSISTSMNCVPISKLDIATQKIEFWTNSKSPEPTRGCRETSSSFWGGKAAIKSSATFSCRSRPP